MSSSSTLPNKYFNRLQVNRLQANNSYVINDDIKSFLYSLLLKSATFIKNNTGGILTFSSADVDSVIQFTDRPLRQSKLITIDDFIDLFSILGTNSFKVDPPNGVLVSDEEQKTYELKTASSDGNGKYTIELLLIDGESHVSLSEVSGRFSLFVDSNPFDNANSPQIISLYNSAKEQLTALNKELVWVYSFVEPDKFKENAKEAIKIVNSTYIFQSSWKYRVKQDYFNIYFIMTNLNKLKSLNL